MMPYLPCLLASLIGSVCLASPPTTGATNPATGPRIINPYYAAPAWKLWFQDEKPVTFRIDGVASNYAPAEPKDRLYPVFPADGSLAVPTISTAAALGGAPAPAGYWDDCFISLDFGHSNLRGRPGQIIIGPKLRDVRPVEPRFLLGANFTSQSYARRGRHIVDDPASNLELEKLFFFANCVRASPAHASFNDNSADKAHDDYDGLFGHAYQSVGQSSSEIHALNKMMLAGGCLPRTTKNLLKTHGAYAIALMTIFKASLPYSDAAGRELPYEHELRHRVAYSSDGNVGHPHFCSQNAHYHGYDDQLHLSRMCRMARGMDIAPPVAVVKCEDLTVEKNGGIIVDHVTKDDRIKNATLTNVRLWGQPGETLTLRLSLNSSYDLQGKPLTFTCQPVYGNQKNVTVKELAAGRYEIVVRHDPKLPKGRIPVLCVARNGGDVPSNPVFVNFYWPDGNERPDFFHFDEKRQAPELKEKLAAMKWVDRPVNINLRPTMDFSVAGDAIACAPGQTVAFAINASDPEGHPVAIYRRSGESGQVLDNTFTLAIPADAPAGVKKIHFIAADGTGGHTGRQVKLLISPHKNVVPDGWQLTTLGSPASAASVDFDGKSLVFANVPAGDKSRPNDGVFVYRALPKGTDFDMVLDLADVPPAGPAVGLLVRGGLDDFNRQAGVMRAAGKATAVVRPGEARFGSVESPADAKLATVPKLIRLASVGGVVSALISADGKSWELLQFTTMETERAFAGVVCLSRTEKDPADSEVRGRWVAPSSPLPLLRTKAKPEREGGYKTPVEFSVTGDDPKSSVRYTLDGSAPTAQSTSGDVPIRLTTPGRHEIRIGAFRDGQPDQTVVATITTQAPAK